MTRDELIEAMARAIYSAEGFVHNSDDRMFEPVKWEEADADEYQCIRDGFRQKADAALTAIEAQGLAIVPVEASEAARVKAEQERDALKDCEESAYQRGVSDERKRAEKAEFAARRALESKP